MGVEILVPNPAIRNLIREDKVHQIYSQQQIGQEKWNMQTLNQSLVDLYLRKLITYEDTISKSQEPDEIKRILAEQSSSQQKQQSAVRR